MTSPSAWRWANLVLGPDAVVRDASWSARALAEDLQHPVLLAFEAPAGPYRPWKLARRGLTRLSLERRRPHLMGLVYEHDARSAPPRGPVGRLKTAISRHLYIEVLPGGEASPMEVLLDELDIEVQQPLRLGTNGGVLAFARLEGRSVVLRVGRLGHESDPLPVADRLDAVSAVAGVPSPRVHARGHVGELAWVAEERLPGAVPGRMTPQLHRQVSVQMSALLDPSREAGASTVRDLSLLCDACPDLEDGLRALVEPAIERLSTLPAATGHGDLWRGNLLVREAQVVGIVDWDAWHEDSTAGLDIVHLYASTVRLRRGQSLGQAWRGTPWFDPSFLDASLPYWRCAGITADDASLQALGTAWWLEEVAGTIRRVPWRASDEGWKQANVGSVLEDGGTLGA